MSKAGHAPSGKCNIYLMLSLPLKTRWEFLVQYRLFIIVCPQNIFFFHIMSGNFSWMNVIWRHNTLCLLIKGDVQIKHWQKLDNIRLLYCRILNMKMRNYFGLCQSQTTNVRHYVMVHDHFIFNLPFQIKKFLSVGRQLNLGILLSECINGHNFKFEIKLS